MSRGSQAEVSPAFSKALLQVYEDNDLWHLKEDVEVASRYSSTVSVPFTGLSKNVLIAIARLPGFDKETPEFQQRLLTYISMLDSPSKPFGRLKALPDAFMQWLATDVIDGWLYKPENDGQMVPYLVEGCYYHEATGSGESYVPASVSIRLVANRQLSKEKTEPATVTLRFRAQECVQKTVAGLIAQHGWYKETPELRATYDQHLEMFVTYQKLVNAQFVNTKSVLQVEGIYYSTTSKTKLPLGSKFVNDESLVHRSFVLRRESSEWKAFVKPGSNTFSQIPIHPFLLLFDLTRDQYVWAHVTEIKPYVYDETMIDKLVLPDTHRDLVNVLVQDMDVFVDDIVAGKSGGTAILCYGAPGLGKTLTAEVYAETIKRPLYKVHSGQLGTTATNVEKTLKDILVRAERWGAVLLLDEADVYVAKRGNDLDRNAVVAGFLRTLEYFNGLMFLTTNRIDDVDDAIVSRMIALFHYETPDRAMATKLWTVLAKQFEIDLTNTQVDWLCDTFPGASGRDIKALLKLVKKWCAQKGVKLTANAWHVCAMFRGIEAVRRTRQKPEQDPLPSE